MLTRQPHLPSAIADTSSWSARISLASRVRYWQRRSSCCRTVAMRRDKLCRQFITDGSALACVREAKRSKYVYRDILFKRSLYTCTAKVQTTKKVLSISSTRFLLIVTTVQNPCACLQPTHKCWLTPHLTAAVTLWESSKGNTFPLC